MENRNLNIDDFFRVELNSYTEVPPADVWESLGKRLDADERKRRFGWWWFIAVLLLVTGGIYFGKGFMHSRGKAIDAMVRVPGNLSLAHNTPARNTKSEIPRNANINNHYDESDTALTINDKNGIVNKRALRKPYARQKTMAYSGYKHGYKSITNTVQAHKRRFANMGIKPGNNSIRSLNSLAQPDTSVVQQSHLMDTNHKSAGDHTSEALQQSNNRPEQNVGNRSPKQLNVSAAKKMKSKEQRDIVAKSMADTNLTSPEANTIIQNDSLPGSKMHKQGVEHPLLGSKVNNQVVREDNYNIVRLKINKLIVQAPILPASSMPSLPMQNAIEPDSIRPDTMAPKANVPDTMADKNKSLDSASAKGEKIRKIDLGFKVGIGRGLQSFSAMNTVLSPYVQINWSDKFSLLLQPGIKYNHVTNNPFSTSPGWYDNIIHDSASFTGTTISNNTTDPRYPKGNDTFDKYTFIRRYDSVAIKHSMASSYWEFELPILLKYRIKPNFSIAAGPVFTFGSAVMINTSKTNYDITTLTGTDSLLAGNKFEQSHADSLLRTPHAPYSSYDSAAYENNISNSFHWGYMLQLSYLFRDKLLIDLSIQQNLSDNGFNTNNYINKLYSQPYIRVSIGYKIATIHKKLMEKP